MTITIRPSTDAISKGRIGQGSLFSDIAKTGRMPSVSLIIKPLETPIVVNPAKALGVPGAGDIVLERFLSYKFSSSILIPVDTFSFSFVAPDGPPLSSVIKEGDICLLSASGSTIATGLIDETEVETDKEFGEKGTINGRDLMAQLEDQDSISLDSTPIWSNSTSVSNAVKMIIADTRISTVETRNAPASNYLLASEPGESKLSTLQRFLEPLNCLFWAGPDGRIIVGKPNMSQAAKGKLILSKERRISNVMDMRVTRSAATIPNAIVPIWAGQELVTDRATPEQVLLNAASGPSRLYKLGHRVPKTVVVSNPQGTTAQGLSDVNAIKVGGANLLQSYAKRELARANQRETIVQAVVPGHFNENGEPYVTDTIYQIEYDRGSVNEEMYLYQVEYELTEDGGQKTNLYFCKKGSIVSDVVAP